MNATTKIRDVTPEEVRKAVAAAGITHIDHHDCGGCGAMVFYSVEDGRLFFNPTCDCSSRWSPAEPRDWSEASDWINMQSAAEKIALAKRFGIELQSDTGAKHSGEG